jgi:hypothetical protein
MANQTITTSVNHDSPSVLGLLNGETYNINGGVLTIDADVRWGQNAAVLGTVSISSSLGGQFFIDATQTWEVAFTSSTGLVPVQNSLGDNSVTGGTSGATGELIRVWGSSLEPLESGVQMPAAGWIKLRSRTGMFVSGETITLPGGATVVASSSGKRSWVHVVGAENTSVIVPRLGTWSARGDWYELGITSGARGQTFQFPVADRCPAIQIETSPGSDVYEWWLNAGNRWGGSTQFVSTDTRGKYFGCTTSGVITIAESTAPQCGLLPAAGCRVRTPNIILSSSTSASWNTNTINATLGTRWKTITTGGGVIDHEYVTGCFFYALTSSYIVRLINCATADQIAMATISNLVDIDGLAVGIISNLDVNTVQLANATGSSRLNNVRAACFVSSTFGRSTLFVSDCINLELKALQLEMFGGPTTTTRAQGGTNTIQLSRVANIKAEGLKLIGARFQGNQVSTSTFKNIEYADCHIGTTQNVSAVYALEFAASVIDTLIDGFSAYDGILNVVPYTGIINYTTSLNFEVRNIGTPSVPYDMGNLSGVIGNGSSASNIIFRRIYVINTRSAPFTSFNTTSNQTFVNVWADYLDTQALGFNSCLAQGVRWTTTTTGQSACYGTHWVDGFNSTTTGYIHIMANEPVAATGSQCAITGGTPRFTSSGEVVLSSIGDQVTWTLPYFALGHTGLSNVSITGNTTNISYQFQYDKGEGFNNTWLALTAANLTDVGTITPEIGLRLIVRATTTTANATNTVTSIRISTTSDLTSQQIQYSLPVESYTLTLNGLQSNSEVRIYRTSDMQEVDGIESVSGNYSYTYPYEGDMPVTIVIFSLAKQPLRIEYLLGRSNSSIPIQQVVDRNYLNP